MYFKGKIRENIKAQLESKMPYRAFLENLQRAAENGDQMARHMPSEATYRKMKHETNLSAQEIMMAIVDMKITDKYEGFIRDVCDLFTPICLHYWLEEQVRKPIQKCNSNNN
jgi:hypothetical protein